MTLDEVIESSLSRDGEQGHPVEVGFATVMVKADADKDVFMAWLQQVMAGSSEFPTLETDRFRGGLSYIELGAYLGSQTSALMVMGLGAFHGVWQILTPRTLGFTDEEEIKQLMGVGMVYHSPIDRLFPGRIDEDR